MTGSPCDFMVFFPSKHLFATVYYWLPSRKKQTTKKSSEVFHSQFFIVKSPRSWKLNSIWIWKERRKRLKCPEIQLTHRTGFVDLLLFFFFFRLGFVCDTCTSSQLQSTLVHTFKSATSCFGVIGRFQHRWPIKRKKAFLLHTQRHTN